MRIDELTNDERLALGGLVRLLVRADGSFSAEEEARIDRIGDELGGKETFWRAISESAQAFKKDTQIRDAALGVTRGEVRSLILDVLTGVAEADTIAPNEATLLLAIRDAWGVTD